MTEISLYQEIKKILVEQFDVEESTISLDANLYQEMDIDSIDAVDLMVHLKELTGKRIPPEQFKEIRTIGDVLEALDTV